VSTEGRSALRAGTTAPGGRAGTDSASLGRPPARAASGDSAPAPAMLRSPGPRRRSGRCVFRLAVNGHSENRDTCRSDRCPENQPDEPRFDHRRPQPTASTSSLTSRLMQPLAFGGCHATHARRRGRVRRLASPSACADLLRRHRSGYRIARLRTTRDFARADKMSSCRADLCNGSHSSDATFLRIAGRSPKILSSFRISSGEGR